jgi:Rod binding domain-containing protein
MSDGFNIPVSKEASGFYSYSLSTAEAKKDPSKVAGQFEALMYRMMFKSMRDASLDEGFFDSFGMSTVKEMQHEELAAVLGQSGKLGIAPMMEKYIEQQEAQDVVRPGSFHTAFSEGLLKE